MEDGARAIEEVGGWFIQCDEVTQGPFRHRPEVITTVDDVDVVVGFPGIGHFRTYTKSRLRKWNADGADIWTMDTFDVLEDGRLNYSHSQFLEAAD